MKNISFSDFDEVLKRPALRKFLGWDEEEGLFMNSDEYKRLYDWITPDEEGNNMLTDAHQIRSLVDFIDEPKALACLDDRNLDRAHHFVALRNQEKEKITLDECIKRIGNAIEAFRALWGKDLKVRCPQKMLMSWLIRFRK